jgi:hypothetical protein
MNDVTEVFIPAGYRADHLIELELPDPRHIVEGILPEGCALIAGRPKIGKSWLNLQLAIAVARGDPLFGHAPTDAGDVCYLALEDNPRRLKSRLAVLLNGQPAPPRLWFYTDWPRLDRGGLEVLADWLREYPGARLVIVDTLAKVKPRRPRNADPYEHDHAVMSSITQLAGRHRIAILCTHHTRKAETDDFLDSVSGTLGLSGGTDATLVLKRARGQADATLSITGRDVDEQELALSFDAERCTWTYMGDADDYRLSTARCEIVEVMQRVNEPMKPVDVARCLERNRATVRWHMAQMGKDGTLKAWSDGKYHLVGWDYQEHRKQHQQANQGQQANVPAPVGDGAVEPVGAVGGFSKNGTKE